MQKISDRSQDLPLSAAERSNAPGSAQDNEGSEPQIEETGNTAPTTPATSGRRKEFVSDLAPAEQVVVWLIRQWLSGDRGEQLAHQELFNLCRITGVEPAVQGLEGLIHTLGHWSRRVMILHCCQCREISQDERLLLFLVAAAQDRQQHLLQALARWLVPIDRAETLIGSAERFGLALSQGGHRLPLELPAAPASPRSFEDDSEMRSIRPHIIVL